jgi:UDP-glucuronate 4-epimerase
MKKVLITGLGGFIGMHSAFKFREEGYEVFGIDNLNDYYDVNLKINRLKHLGFEGDFSVKNKVFDNQNGIKFQNLDLGERDGILETFKEERFDIVLNLAAQAGVRYSLINPYSYVDSNITGFLNILEACRSYPVEHLVYASSSSVYGLNEEIPYKESHVTSHPVSLYAASKKSNELFAHTYSHLFGIPTTGLRFFTVYGPWGRPDMALFIFTDKILKGEEIQVFNHGDMLRDFTYVDDIVNGVFGVSQVIPEKREGLSMANQSPNLSTAPYSIYNIGNSNPVKLLDFVTAIEKELGVEAKKVLMDIQPGDVSRTYADSSNLFEAINHKPNTSIEDGVKGFIDWYKEYYGITIN